MKKDLYGKEEDDSDCNIGDGQLDMNINKTDDVIEAEKESKF